MPMVEGFLLSAVEQCVHVEHREHDEQRVLVEQYVPVEQRVHDEH